MQGAWRLGVRGRLWLSFAAISLLPIIAALVSLHAFQAVEASLDAVAGRELPRIEISLQLARQGDRVVLAGLGLAEAPNAEIFATQQQALEEEAARADALLAKLGDGSAVDGRAAGVKAALGKLREGIARTATLSKEIIDGQAKLAPLQQQVGGLAQRFSAALEPFTTEQHSAMNGVLTTLGGDTAAEERQAAVRKLQGVADAARAINRMSAANAALQSAFAGIPGAREAGDLDRIGQAARRELNTLRTALDDLDEKAEKALSPLIAEWEKLARGNPAQQRRDTLAAQAKHAALMSANQQLAGDLAAAIEAGIAVAKSETDATTATARSTVVDSIFWLYATAAIGLALALLIGWLYVGRNVVRRLVKLELAMRGIAAGDLATEVPHAAHDEIGAMAKTLGIFKDNIIERRRLESERAEFERRAETERRNAVTALAARFKSSVSGLVEAVASSSTEMQASARSMAAIADDTDRQANLVSTASHQASHSVESVATAAEELSASVRQIGDQVAQSATIAGQAVDEARRTDGIVTGLSQAAERIGAVVQLIGDIASQTNLLALNATIEAARAGDAGKGFAVVASEVKTLANQTAKATEEITGQIKEIQGATGQAVGAIRGIAATIARINDIAREITSAVDHQGNATEQIAQSIDQAASGARTVSVNIGGVTRAASETGIAAKQVLDAATELSHHGETLRTEVDTFLATISAA